MRRKKCSLEYYPGVTHQQKQAALSNLFVFFQVSANAAILFNWNFFSLPGRFKIYLGLEWFKKCLTEYCACLDLNFHHVEDKSNPNRNVNIGEVVTVVR